MKKVISILFVFLIVFGCMSTGVSAAEKEPVDLYFGGGGVGGSFYSMAAALGSVVGRETGYVKISTVATGGGGENLMGLSSGEFDISFVSTDLPYMSARGGDPENPAAIDYPGLRTIMMFEPGPFYAIRKTANTAYANFADIAKPGTRIAINNPGGGPYMIAKAFLEALNLNMDELTLMPGSHGQLHESLQDDNADVITNMIVGLTTPGSAVTELAINSDIEFIPIPKEIRDIVNEKYPYCTPCTIQPGWCEDLKVPYETLGITYCLLVDEKLDDQVVYDILNVVFNNLDDLAQGDANWSYVTKTSATDGFPTPLHPGAQRYYEENGFKINILQ